MLVYPNAKINLGLNVVEKRPDGYHNIETIFYPIGLHDVLSVETSDTCSDYSFSVSGINIGGDAEDNLIVKSYRLLRSKYQFPPVDISLLKQIPFGAGLGGGSSDAAFMLKALNEEFKLKITPKHLEQLASKLGSDCPFFIRNKPVYATGTGNIFAPADVSLKGYILLLVKPDIHVSTAEAYAGITPQPSASPLTELIRKPIADWKHDIKNDFEKSVFEKFPAIAAIKSELYQMGAIYASMSGSGSSVYGIFGEIPEYRDRFENCFVACGELE
ncbi:MAG TPA: 4-(cytidine 5'-diphospho)-2-C-methyl-D-erythritol kinase [Paludibacteraceae bacterium]|nr:4-(cytidine 5'-diphospho)-2-C-methyl-D-erythritol kinase [Paludibacteraceae bacterium]HPT42437.1 4-(cytidine 5'-diphospho)-2-C-methyl-D-erythritol kinase [Paludibacteraceae bacterium]